MATFSTMSEKENYFAYLGDVCIGNLYLCFLLLVVIPLFEKNTICYLTYISVVT